LEGLSQPKKTLVKFWWRSGNFYGFQIVQDSLPLDRAESELLKPWKLTAGAALISVHLALSQTPVYTVRPRTRGIGIARCAVCLITL